MHIIPGFIVRQIAGETVAVPTGEAAHNLSGLIILNETGQRIFELLQTEQTEEALVKSLLDEFDIDESTARSDVSEFLQILRNADVLSD